MAQIDRGEDTCTLDSLNGGAPCYNCLADSEKKKAQIYLLTKILAALGETDYSDVNDLRDLVKCFCVSESQLEAYKLLLLAEEAVSLDVYESLPGADDLREAVRCWNCGLSLKEMKAAEAVLLCKWLHIALAPT
jgi:hypothetical protein